MSTALETVNQIPVLPLPEGVELLPDNKSFTNRVDFQSSSGKTYRLAQSKKGRWWACSCPSYVYGKKGAKTCKHLRDFGLSGNFLPEEVGRLAIGGETEVGSTPMPDSEKDERTASHRAQLRAVKGGRNESEKFFLRGKTFPIKDEIKKLGGSWDRSKKAWVFTSQEAFSKAEALLKGAREAEKPAPAPKALPAATPENIEFQDGKMVVTFSAEQAQAVFAMLAQQG